MRRILQTILCISLILGQGPVSGSASADTQYLFREQNGGAASQTRQLSIAGPASFKAHVAGSVAATYTASGGRPLYVFSAAGLPANLAISAAGSITGSATVPGTFAASVSVVDAANATASEAVSIEVLAELEITSASGTAQPVNTPVTLTGSPSSPWRGRSPAVHCPRPVDLRIDAVGHGDVDAVDDRLSLRHGLQRRPVRPGGPDHQLTRTDREKPEAWSPERHHASGVRRFARRTPDR